MCREKVNFLRAFDAYAMPLNFTYKKETEFTTTTGGIVTIIVSLILFFYACQQIVALFLEPDYFETVVTTYHDFTVNDDKIEVDT